MGSTFTKNRTGPYPPKVCKTGIVIPPFPPGLVFPPALTAYARYHYSHVASKKSYCHGTMKLLKDATKNYWEAEAKLPPYFSTMHLDAELFLPNTWNIAMYVHQTNPYVVWPAIALNGVQLAVNWNRPLIAVHNWNFHQGHPERYINCYVTITL